MIKTPEKVLYVDLANRSYDVAEQPELFDKFLGGSGLAIELLTKECPQGTDPFAPENPIIMAPGPLGGLFPSAGKTVATFKSPVTGNLGETHAGGRLAVSLKLAGYGALVIKSTSDAPLLLEIGKDSVSFRDASPLKGLSSLESERRLRGCAAVARMQSVLSIGSAGENKVSYACVNVDRYNYFGRLGLGAVFGAKNLKAISIVGSGYLEVPSPEAYKRVFKKIYKEEIETDKMRKYHFTGTPANVSVLNEIRALPTKNFQRGTFENADEICGEVLGERWLNRKVSCPLCPIGCMHIAGLRPAFASGYEYEPIDVYNNYESIYALGSNLCVRDAEGVLRLIHRANSLGIDTMLAGNVLAWATEAFEKGLISTKHTEGLILKWGDVETYLAMMDKVVSRSNGFYQTLAKGVERAAETYGGAEFAMAIGGNGLAGYYTGYASMLGTVVGARHSHNDNAGYDIDQRMLQEKMKPDLIIEDLSRENEWRYVLTSLVICLFARKVYSEKNVVEALKAIGINRSLKELKNLGKTAYQHAFDFKFREGFDFSQLRIPNRIFESPTANGKLDEAVFAGMMQKYLISHFSANLQKKRRGSTELEPKKLNSPVV
jgi:aldehyde:ferredoxin oxidoreductase